MPTDAERYVVNEKGERQAVLLDIELYEHILEELEELACIRAYDSAKESDQEVIEFEQAVEEIESKRA